MPEHLRSIECCYCSASNLVNLRELKDQTLKCCECGAGMAFDRAEAEISTRPGRVSGARSGCCYALRRGLSCSGRP